MATIWGYMGKRLSLVYRLYNKYDKIYLSTADMSEYNNLASAS